MSKLSSEGPFLITSKIGKVIRQRLQTTAWPKPQFIKYAVFLHFHANRYQICITKQLNNWDFFRRLSIFVQSKNANQCRIFHKKMMAQHGNIDHLIHHLKSTIDQFQDWSQMYAPSLVNLSHCLLREVNSIISNSKMQPNINKRSDYLWTIEGEKQGLEDEKIKDQLKPTDSNYPQEQKIKNQKVEKVEINRSSLSKSVFDSRLNTKVVSHSLFELYNQNMDKQKAQQKYEQWEDCHSSFLIYCSKLNNLNKKEN